MKLGDRGAQLIKSYEELRLKAYLPTPNDKPTIGWGHTRNVKLGDICNIAKAEEWFRQDVEEAETYVNKIGTPLTQAMFDALVSLVFNVGIYPTLDESIIGGPLRQGKYYKAWRGFDLYINQAGKPLLGLARRRAREMFLFLEDGLP